MRLNGLREAIAKTFLANRPNLLSSYRSRNQAWGHYLTEETAQTQDAEGEGTLQSLTNHYSKCVLTKPAFCPFDFNNIHLAVIPSRKMPLSSISSIRILGTDTPNCEICSLATSRTGTNPDGTPRTCVVTSC